MTMEFHYNIIIDTKRPQSSTFTETSFFYSGKNWYFGIRLILEGF